MEPQTVRLLLVGCAGAVAIAAIIGSVADVPHEPTPIEVGTIYSTETGDPLDVVASVDEEGICVNVGGVGYGSIVSCTDEGGAVERGSYVVVLPVSGSGATYVVGVMPEAAAGATVAAGDEELRADTRGRWFLAELPDLDADEAQTVVVDFYT